MIGWKEEIAHWQKQARHYSVKAILQEALALHEAQEQRIEHQKGKLDGMMWSPKEWNEEEK